MVVWICNSDHVFCNKHWIHFCTHELKVIISSCIAFSTQQTHYFLNCSSKLVCSAIFCYSLNLKQGHSPLKLKMLNSSDHTVVQRWVNGLNCHFPWQSIYLGVNCALSYLMEIKLVNTTCSAVKIAIMVASLLSCPPTELEGGFLPLQTTCCSFQMSRVGQKYGHYVFSKVGLYKSTRNGIIDLSLVQTAFITLITLFKPWVFFRCKLKYYPTPSHLLLSISPDCVTVSPAHGGFGFHCFKYKFPSSLKMI